MSKANHQLIHSSARSDWRTPAHIVSAVHDVLGVIDLDPASDPASNELLQARSIFTQVNDGLVPDWHASTVFCNPPYGYAGGIDPRSGQWNPKLGKPNQLLWSQKMIGQFESCFFDQGILLVNAETSATWFRPLWDYDVCLVYGRLCFLDSDWQPARQPTHDNAIVYFGMDVAQRRKFEKVFRSIGRVIKA